MVAEHLIRVLIKHGTDSFFYFDQAKLILELEEFYTDHDSALRYNTGFVCLALAALALGSQWTALQPKAAAPIMVGKDVKRIGTACYTQARALIPDLDDSLSLESVQAPLVLGVYLLPARATGSLHMYLGLALRKALALDLHLDSGADMYSNHDKEIRSRLWWAIFSVERQVITRPIFFPMSSSLTSHHRTLTVKLNRPRSIDPNIITVSLPRPIQSLDEAQVFDNLIYQIANAQLTLILDRLSDSS